MVMTAMMMMIIFDVHVDDDDDDGDVEDDTDDDADDDDDDAVGDDDGGSGGPKRIFAEWLILVWFCWAFRVGGCWRSSLQTSDWKTMRTSDRISHHNCSSSSSSCSMIFLGPSSTGPAAQDNVCPMRRQHHADWGAHRPVRGTSSGPGPADRRTTDRSAQGGQADISAPRVTRSAPSSSQRFADASGRLLPVWG